MRTTTASLATACAALLGAGLLTGCSQTTTHESDCEAPFSSGALSKTVQVLGEFGTSPDVTFPDSVSYEGAQAYIAHRADNRSEEITERSIVTLNYKLIESSTGTVLDESDSFTDGRGHDMVQVDPDAEQSVFPGGLLCAAPGDRVILTLSPEEAESFAGTIDSDEDEQLALIVVTDIHDVRPINNPGKAVNLPSGFPGVVTDDEGQPGIVTAPGAAPTTTRVAERIKGDGEEITAESTLVGNVLSVTWDGRLLENSYAEIPQFLGNAENTDTPVRAHLNGARVGSQVVVITPDEEGSAVISVVDILAAVE